MIAFLVFLALLVAVFASFYLKRFKLCLLLIFLTSFQTRMFVSLDPMLHPWDERYHALVAKNLLSDPLHPMLIKEPAISFEKENWTGNQTWVHKQPLPLYSMAMSIAVFGTKAWAVRLPSVLLGSLCTFFVFIIGFRLWDEKVGLIASFLYATNGFLIEQAGGRVPTDHIDAFHLIFTLSSIAMVVEYHVRQKDGFLYLAGVFLGCAILSKWLTALIVFPVFFFLSFRDIGFKSFLISCIKIALPAIIVAAPWQIFIYQNFPEEAAIESASNWAHIIEVLDGMEGGPLFHIDKIRMLFGDFIYLPLILFVYLIIRRGLFSKEMAVFIWLFIPLLFFSLVATKMRGYTSFAAPALFLMSAVSWFEIRDMVQEKHRKIWLGLGILCLGLSLRFSFERIKFFQSQEEAIAIRESIFKLEELGMQDGVVVFNNPYPIESMFFNGGTSYSWCPNEKELLEGDFEYLILDENCSLSFGRRVESPF